MDPIQWLGYILIFQTVVLYLQLHFTNSTLDKILEKLEADA